LIDRFFMLRVMRECLYRLEPVRQAEPRLYEGCAAAGKNRYAGPSWSCIYACTLNAGLHRSALHAGRAAPVLHGELHLCVGACVCRIEGVPQEKRPYVAVILCAGLPSYGRVELHLYTISLKLSRTHEPSATLDLFAG
jgi:hypothetical protein